MIMSGSCQTLNKISLNKSNISNLHAYDMVLANNRACVFKYTNFNVCTEECPVAEIIINEVQECKSQSASFHTLIFRD